MVFLVHVVGPVICFSVLFISSAEATLSVVQQAMEFPQPRPCSVLLRCQRHCGITGRRCLRNAHSIVPNGMSVISVTALDDLNLCYSRNLGCLLVVLCQITSLAVLPLTGLVITVRMVAASGPLTPPPATVLRVLLRGRSPVPVVLGGRLTIVTRVARHFEYGASVYWAANSLSANPNGLREYNHMQQRIPRDMRTHDGHSIHVLHMPDCEGVKVQVRRRTVCGREQEDNQLAADSAVNFTSRTGTLGHTRVSCVRAGAISNCTPLFSLLSSSSRLS